MQQDVLSIFIYFNDRIASAEVRIQMSKADRHLDRYQRKHDTARVDRLTRVNVCLLSAFAETSARHSCGS